MNGDGPSKEALRAWIRAHPDRANLRELARAFDIRDPGGRRRLKEAIRQSRGERKAAAPRSGPRVVVAEVVKVTRDGDLVAKPSVPSASGPAEIILSRAAPRRRTGRHAAGVGDRVLVRLDTAHGSSDSGHIVARLPKRRETFVGVIVPDVSGGLRVENCGAKPDTTHRFQASETAGVGEGVHGAGRPGGGDQAGGPERIGALDDPRCIPAMVAARYEIPTRFDADAEQEAAACGPPTDHGRTDLTGLPFVTIDGDDARDFDDAVAAAAGPDGGFRIHVAIADVAHYVRPGGALDRAAQVRGNSVYFPGHVLPMLPASLSNGWCSLVPRRERAALVAALDIGPRGELVRAEFARALIRSRARLTYEALDEAARLDAPISGIDRADVAALYGAYRVLRAARDRRGALDLSSAEHRITLDPVTGEPDDITAVRQLDSHRLIEEFMVLANTAVARHLTRQEVPFLYRVHGEPRSASLRSLQNDLRALTGRWRTMTGRASTRRFNDVLEGARGAQYEEAVHLAVLRAQTQAEYSPENIGHFGLGLQCYTHFTSPIRRYSDLSVHRSLLATLGFEPQVTYGEDELCALGRDLSSSERWAVAAEREACQRYASRFLQRMSAASMQGRIVSVERFGAFVRLGENGIEGLLPMSGLGDGYFRFDARARQISIERSGETFRPGDAITVRLADIDPIRGRVAFRRVRASVSH
ncbi:MAG: VacB/RNase II family 3'-5' exoribonuclease [Rhodospirillales bacterium]|nr:VacB/RNase II family 3'-5' exoribonuclease [Rhodospirillales bacterium]